MFLFEHIRFLHMLQNLISEYSMFLIARKYNIDYTEVSEIGNRNMDIFVFEHIGFMYMSQNQNILNLAKFIAIAYFFIQYAYQMVKHCCYVLIECDSCFVVKRLWYVLVMSCLSIKCQVTLFCLIENVADEMVKHPSCVSIDSYRGLETKFKPNLKLNP